jgi:hypothetical protein
LFSRSDADRAGAATGDHLMECGKIVIDIKTGISGAVRMAPTVRSATPKATRT